MNRSVGKALDRRLSLLQVYRRRFRAIGIGNSLRILLKPKWTLFHLRRLLLGDTRGLSNFYAASISRTDEIIFCCKLLGCAEAAVEEAFSELERDVTFVEQISKRYERVRPDSPIVFSIGRFKAWYAIVRLLKPNVVLETGVHDGLSSTLILRAMSLNCRGSLLSIDLPSLDLPINVDGPGWLVPEELKSRWYLNIGDARLLLPRLSHEYAPIDVFIHDSDHSSEFQNFEYRTVRPFLSTAGLLLTDDAIPEMFSKLAEEWKAVAFFVSGSTEQAAQILAGIRFNA
jgi:hypothetical protein